MKIKMDNMLCAIDFSELSKKMLKYSIGLAKRFDATLYIFHAVSFPRRYLQDTAIMRPNEKDEIGIKKANEKIEHLMKWQSVKWKPIVLQGETLKGIIKAVDDHNIDLVIAASLGLSGFTRMIVGTIVEPLARTLKRPFWVLPPAKGMERKALDNPEAIKKILVGCSIQPNAASIYQYALLLAKIFNAKLHIVHAVESPLNENIVNPTQKPYPETQETLIFRLEERIRELIDQEPINDCEVEISILPGIPGEVLLSQASKKNADLIVVGVHQQGKIKKALMGSTTETMLRNAPCPVLTIPYNA